MATSSIFTNPIISDPKKAEEFIVNYINMTEKKLLEKKHINTQTPLTDIDKIREFMSKRFTVE